MDFSIPLSQQILTSVSRLDQFKGRWSSGQGVSQARLDRIAEASRIQSVAASCRLSGIRISDADVAGLLRGESLQLRDAGDVQGYSAALDYPFPATDRVLTSMDLRWLHAVLAARAGEPGEPSPWRLKPHQFEAFDAQGHATGRIFSALPPRMVEGKIEDLLTWLEFELRTGERHPILVIGTFLLGFRAASPFDSHNGRMTRVLTYHLLRRAGYEYIPYASLESGMEELRESFQDAFDRAQTRFWKGESKLEPWVHYFLEVLTRHRERVEAKIDLEREALAQTPLQRSILDVVREHGTVDAGLLLRATGANRNTLKDNLRRLVDRGMLERTGQRRGTRYRLAAANRARSAIGAPHPGDVEG
jgi:Fic family protein